MSKTRNLHDFRKSVDIQQDDFQIASGPDLANSVFLYITSSERSTDLTNNRKSMTDNYKYFLVAFHNVLSNMPITQRKVADRSGTAYQTINAIVWDKHTAGPGKQEAIALACGFSLVDFLNKGREIVEYEGDIKPATGHPQPRYFNSLTSQPV